MQFIMKLLREKKKRQEDELKLQTANKMVATWRMVCVLRKIRVWRNAAIELHRITRGGVGRAIVWERKDKYSRLIQRGWNGKVQRTYLMILLDNLRRCKLQAEGSSDLSEFVERKIEDSKKMKEQVREKLLGRKTGGRGMSGSGMSGSGMSGSGTDGDKEKNWKYFNPGMDKNSDEFKKLKRQATLIYDKEETAGSFEAVDACLVSNVLNHPECGIRDLVISRADLSDSVGANAIAQAMEKNRSVTSIGLVDCNIDVEKGIDVLFKHIRRTNFCVEVLCLDKMGNKFGDFGGKMAADLVGDFFVHQVSERSLLTKECEPSD